MSGQNSRCAYCGEPLVFTALGVKAWRAGNEFVCNEFCADEISSSPNDSVKAAWGSSELGSTSP
jgi:hypothetical protein